LVVGGLAKLRGKEDIVPSPSVAASVLAAPSAAPAAVSDAALGDTVTRSETVLDTKTVDASAGLLVKKTPKTRDRNAPKSAPTSRIDPFGDQK
jgi:hypothetical protein